LEEEVFFQCPHCWQQISMVFDSTAGSQTYVEDCEICCGPIKVSYSVSENGELSIQSATAEL